MNDKLKPALLGGGALGVLLIVTTTLAGLAPALGFLGCCNCLWPIAAGLLATMLFIKRSPTPASNLDGVTIGALAGLIGGLIYLGVGVPLSYFLGRAEQVETQVHRFMPDFPIGGFLLLVFGALIGLILYIILGLLGGLIAIPIFEKRKGNEIVPPPAPQNFGAGPGSYGSSS